MAWLELHQEVPNHPKTDALMDELSVGRATAVGHLTMGWLWAMQYAQDGVIEPKRLGAIARGSDWHGDPKAFAAGMVAAGWWDEAGDGWAIHDWDHWGARLIEKRRADAERKAASRSGGHPPDGPRGVRRTVHRTSEENPADDMMDGAGTNQHTNQHDRPTGDARPRKRAHASKPTQAGDGEPEGSATGLEEQNLAGSAGLEAEDEVPPAGPAGLPKPAASVLTEAQVAALVAVLWPGATIRPDQVPNGVASWLRQEYPPQDYPAVHATWRDLGPGGRAAWCAEALGRPAVQAKPAKDRMRSAARHIGRALHDGFDLLTERDDAPPPSAAPSQPAPQGTRFDHYPWAKWWMHDLYRGMAPDGRLLACAKEAKAAGWPIDPDEFLERYYADRGDRATLIERFMSELWALKPGASEAGKVA